MYVCGCMCAISRFVTESLSLDALEFLTVLGKGSFGTVVLCRRPKDTQLYAMKVHTPHMTPH